MSPKKACRTKLDMPLNPMMPIEYMSTISRFIARVLFFVRAMVKAENTTMATIQKSAGTPGVLKNSSIGILSPGRGCESTSVADVSHEIANVFPQSIDTLRSRGLDVEAEVGDRGQLADVR